MVRASLQTVKTRISQLMNNFKAGDKRNANSSTDNVAAMSDILAGEAGPPQKTAGTKHVEGPLFPPCNDSNKLEDDADRQSNASADEKQKAVPTASPSPPPTQSSPETLTQHLKAMTVEDPPADTEQPHIAASTNNSAKQPQPPTPPHPIFTTYELVENIVLYMTTYDLTIAPHVCAAWRDIIERSKDLRSHISKLQPPGRKTLRPDEHRNRIGLSPQQKTWHFAARIPKGKLLLTRVQGREMALFIPHSIRQPVISLDGRYEKRIHLLRSGEKRLVWYDREGKEICSTIRRDEMGCSVGRKEDPLGVYMRTFYGKEEEQRVRVREEEEEEEEERRSGFRGR